MKALKVIHGLRRTTPRGILVAPCDLENETEYHGWRKLRPMACLRKRQQINALACYKAWGNNATEILEHNIPFLQMLSVFKGPWKWLWEGIDPSEA